MFTLSYLSLSHSLTLSLFHSFTLSLFHTFTLSHFQGSPVSSPSSGYNSSGTGSGSQEDEGRHEEEEEEEEERLLIDLSSPSGESTSVTLLGPPAGPSLINSRRSWTTFDDDDQNNAFTRYYPFFHQPSNVQMLLWARKNMSDFGTGVD